MICIEGNLCHYRTMASAEREHMIFAAAGRRERLTSIITGLDIGHREEIVCDSCKKHVTWRRFGLDGRLLGLSLGEPRQVDGEGEYCSSCQHKLLRTRRDSSTASIAE